MTINSHGGSRTTNLIADLPGYSSPVWYDANDIANILSLSNVQRLYKITYDSTRGNRFVVHLGNRLISFEQCPKGLYFYDTKQSGLLFVATVKGKKQSYTKREVKGAEAARKLQQVIQFPTTNQFKEIIRNNVIKNCPITLRDIDAAEDIFGPSVYALKGRTTRKNPDPVKMWGKYEQIPRKIKKRNQKVSLCGDIMFVSSLPFIITVSRKIKLLTAEFLVTQKEKDIFASIKKPLNSYKRGICSGNVHGG